MEDMLVLFVSAYPELHQKETPLGADQLDTCGIVLRVGSLLFCGVNPLLTYCKLSAKLILTNANHDCTISATKCAPNLSLTSLNESLVSTHSQGLV